MNIQALVLIGLVYASDVWGMDLIFTYGTGSGVRIHSNDIRHLQQPVEMFVTNRTQWMDGRLIEMGWHAAGSLVNSYAPHAGIIMGAYIYLFSQHREWDMGAAYQHYSSYGPYGGFQGSYYSGLSYYGAPPAEQKIRYWCERQRYDIARKVWDTISWRNCYPNMGEPVLEWERFIYSFGHDPWPNNTDYDHKHYLTMRFDPARELWEEIPTMAHRHRLAAWVIWRGQLYMIGGAQRYSVRIVLKYDFYSNRWIEAAPLNEARCQHAATVYLDTLWVAGGCADHHIHTSVERYDFQRDAWIPMGPLLRPRMDLELVVANGRLFALGGRSYVTPGTNIFHAHRQARAQKSLTSDSQSTIQDPGLGPVNGNYYSYYATKYGPDYYKSTQFYNNPNALHYFVGGGGVPGDEVDRESSVEEFDPWQNAWRYAASMVTAKSNFPAIVLRNYS